MTWEPVLPVCKRPLMCLFNVWICKATKDKTDKVIGTRECLFNEPWSTLTIEDLTGTKPMMEFCWGEEILLVFGRKSPNQSGFQRQNRELKEFKLKVDIPSFNSNLGIKDFLDSIVKIERFFEYMHTPKD